MSWGQRGAEEGAEQHDWVQDVLSFHKRFQSYVGETPRFPHTDTLALRVLLIAEEIGELSHALETGDLVETADAIGDSIYVLIGLALACGIDLRPVWREIHDTNMAKVFGGEGKKVVKPEHWRPPDIAGLLEAQCGDGGK